MFGFVNTSIVIREAGEERTTVAVTTIKGPVPRRISLRVLIFDVTASLGKLSPLVKLYRLLLNFQFGDWEKFFNGFSVGCM